MLGLARDELRNVNENGIAGKAVPLDYLGPVGMQFTELSRENQKLVVCNIRVPADEPLTPRRRAPDESIVLYTPSPLPQHAGHDEDVAMALRPSKRTRVSGPVGLPRSVTFAKMNRAKADTFLTAILKVCNSDLTSRFYKPIEDHIKLIDGKLEQLEDKDLPLEDAELPAQLIERQHALRLFVTVVKLYKEWKQTGKFAPVLAQLRELAAELAVTQQILTFPYCMYSDIGAAICRACVADNTVAVIFEEVLSRKFFKIPSDKQEGWECCMMEESLKAVFKTETPHNHLYELLHNLLQPIFPVLTGSESLSSRLADVMEAPETEADLCHCLLDSVAPCAAEPVEETHPPLRADTVLEALASVAHVCFPARFTELNIDAVEESLRQWKNGNTSTNRLVKAHWRI